ncbi:hypothetical protein STRCI_001312 [Streptomyces cinnabarinus]|uniref:TetR family transcriptional regulator n=1 Tax=Streptomyces cinnabarinus TaxID=67287 RepID=A0ABY7KB94_9ACTN|nr:hypothetical protein [Streptomyces cinnabarinus]WAZ20211.1 hypothetical protein STRCI_001312 [Streptomyces cinnabarinus]
MPDEIPAPITELAAMAVQHHEAFQAWVDAGFTEAQALDLLKTIILRGIAGGA